MSDDKRKEFVDELLDASLRRYAQVEPRAGLEERLLTGVPEQAQRFAWPSWAWIPVAAAILIAALAFYATRPAPAPSVPSVARQVPTVPAAPTMSARATPPASVPHPGVSRVRVERAPSAGRLGAGPRLTTFPARAPLSEQERLLLRFMQQAPKEQLMARQLGAGFIERLEIQPLTVPSLENSKSTTEN